MENISLTEDCAIEWDGEGWYATIVTQNYDGDFYTVCKVGDANTPQPDVYGTGYGTPAYMTTPE